MRNGLLRESRQSRDSRGLTGLERQVQWHGPKRSRSTRIMQACKDQERFSNRGSKFLARGADASQPHTPEAGAHSRQVFECLEHCSREVKKYSTLRQILKNLPGTRTSRASREQPRRTALSTQLRFDSIVVEVERPLVRPAAAAELRTALGYFVEVCLTLLLFSARGVGSQMLGVGVVKAQSHDLLPFYLVTQVTWSQALRPAFPLASSVPDSSRPSESLVVAGLPANCHFSGDGFRTNPAPPAIEFLHRVEQVFPVVWHPREVIPMPFLLLRPFESFLSAFASPFFSPLFSYSASGA